MYRFVTPVNVDLWRTRGHLARCFMFHQQYLRELPNLHMKLTKLLWRVPVGMNAKAFHEVVKVCHPTSIACRHNSE